MHEDVAMTIVAIIANHLFCSLFSSVNPICFFLSFLLCNEVRSVPFLFSVHKVRNNLRNIMISTFFRVFRVFLERLFLSEKSKKVRRLACSIFDFLKQKDYICSLLCLMVRADYAYMSRNVLKMNVMCFGCSGSACRQI